jgi:hypothetical protein
MRRPLARSFVAFLNSPAGHAVAAATLSDRAAVPDERAGLDHGGGVDERRGERHWALLATGLRRRGPGRRGPGRSGLVTPSASSLTVCDQPSFLNHRPAGRCGGTRRNYPFHLLVFPVTAHLGGVRVITAA